MFTRKTTLIIPTRNRFNQIIRNLRYFQRNLIYFKEIIIIDSSDKIQKKKLTNIVKKYKNIKLIFSKPSSSRQRNLGLKNTNKKSKFVMFLDDDIYFFKNAFSCMDKSIENETKHTVGFSFNVTSKNKNQLSDKFKKNNIFKLLNIYSDKPGIVTKSGWHTKIINLEKDIYADWLSTQAVVYYKKDLKNIWFEEKFGQYSYLEDLDFSYKLKKRNKNLKVVYKAKYKSPLISKRHGFTFGKIEIYNRYLFVKKNSLDYSYFLIGSLFRSLQSLGTGLIFFNLKSINRFFGNIYGILISIKKIKSIQLI